MKKASLMDVAKAAGVSHMTVARVINGGSVSRATRELVEQKIRELGYIPNQMARALKSDKSGILGSLCIHNSSGLIHHMNESISKAARKHGYELLIIETEAGNEEAAIRNLLSLQADGIAVLSDPLIQRDSLAQLGKLAVPVVAVERGYDAPGVDNLLVADYAACRDMARRIAAHGHRRAALIESRELDKTAPELNVEHQRRSGFLNGAKENGLTVSGDLICTMDTYSAGEGYRATERLLALPEPPTAIFATSDRLAAGVLQCLYAHRLRVPEDMSVIGYDNMLSAQLSPAIDSVALNFADIGDTVLSFLLGRMQNYDAPGQTGAIQTEYIDRGTLLRVRS